MHEPKTIPVKKLFDVAKIPTKANVSDAGYDLYSIEKVKIWAGETVLVSTGISMKIPEGYVGLIWDRSSMGVKGIHRHAGVIDSGYRGHIKVCLHNTTKDVYHVECGDRIAQIVIQQCPHFELCLVDSLDNTERGSGGFGSTGR
jgi:dUTP pyrophosphatase|tara:strand:- start:527 stop:958 length:432 start_codon:yes stop_codon:yes gene_type:complete